MTYQLTLDIPRSSRAILRKAAYQLVLEAATRGEATTTWLARSSLTANEFIDLGDADNDQAEDPVFGERSGASAE
jgi:hypothetical protein